MKTTLISTQALRVFTSILVAGVTAVPAMAVVSKEELATIGVPDMVQTSIGTRKYWDGVPMEETAQKIYDYLDLMLGVQAYIDNQDASSMFALRRGFQSLGANRANQVVIHERTMDADTLFPIANLQAVYLFTFLDLKTDGPTVVEIAPKTLGFLDNMWQTFIADLGLTGPDKGEGGKYLVLPPGYKGDVPDGYHVVHSPTYGVWYTGQCFLKDGDPKPGLDIIKAHMRVYPLSKADNPPKTQFINASGKQYDTISPGTFQFFEDINEIIQTEPVESVGRERAGLLAAIGIQKGKPFEPDARMKRILTEAAAIGSGLGQGSDYAALILHPKGNALDGSKTYRLTFPPDIPVANSWSVTIYDSQTRSVLRTSQRGTTLSSVFGGVEQNPDGSTDLYFGPKVPMGKRMNWLQTVPGRSWFIVLRMYGPEKTWLDKTWRPGEFELVK